MDIEKLAEQAVERKGKGNNCAQAVAVTLAEAEGLPADTAWQATAGFGGGMGTMEGACGSLVGAGIVMGLRTKGDKTMPYARLLSASFKQKCGAVTCKILKGTETGEVLCPCDDCVRNAVRAYGEITEL